MRQTYSSRAQAALHIYLNIFSSLFPFQISKSLLCSSSAHITYLMYLYAFQKSIWFELCFWLFAIGLDLYILCICWQTHECRGSCLHQMKSHSVCSSARLLPPRANLPLLNKIVDNYLATVNNFETCSTLDLFLQRSIYEPNTWAYNMQSAVSTAATVKANKNNSNTFGPFWCRRTVPTRPAGRWAGVSAMQLLWFLVAVVVVVVGQSLHPWHGMVRANKSRHSSHFHLKSTLGPQLDH